VTSIGQILRKSLLAAAFLSSAALAADAPPAAKAAAVPGAAQHGDDAVYATVNGKPILIRDYTNAFSATLRQKFYHGKVPEGQMGEVREQVTDQLVQRVLLLDEAKKRGLTPDEKAVEATVAGYEAQYAANPVWKENRERLLPGLHTQLSEQNLLEQLEKSARDVPEPSEAEVKQFYERHPELFTEPEKLRLSVIMLTVDPSAPKAAWDQARAEAQAIYGRLQSGADFAEAARMHSSGKEAEQGGDLGYVHRGMLPEVMQQKVDDFKVGETAEPITLLEGVAIFRLEDRRSAQLRSFADVAERASGLARRERQDAAWLALVARLKSAADIRILVGQLPGEESGAHR